MTKNEYAQCSTYTSMTGTNATGNYYHYHYRSHSPCIGCSHTECPHWRPPCCRKHRYWPYPHRRYYPWWQWTPDYPPYWTTTTVTWNANPSTTVTYNTGTDPQTMIGSDGTGWTS